MKHLLLASTALLAVSVSSSAAPAAPSAEPPPGETLSIPHVSYNSNRARLAFVEEQRKLLIEAQALEKAGKIQEALDKYQDAYAILSYSDATLELAFAQARAGLFLPAARNIQETLTLFSLPEYRLHTLEEVRAVFAYCKKHIATIHMTINIPDVRVTIDGEEVKEWPFHEEIYVEPGKHHIKATKLGYWMNQTTVEIGKGERKDLSIAMQQRVHTQLIGFERPVNFSLNTSTTTSESESNPTWPLKVMIASGVGMGLGVGALATGLVLRSDGAEGQTSGAWTGVAVGGAVLAGLSLTGLIIGAAGIASRPTPTPKVYITPQIAKDGGGVQLAGSIE